MKKQTCQNIDGVVLLTRRTSKTFDKVQSTTGLSLHLWSHFAPVWYLSVDGPLRVHRYMFVCVCVCVCVNKSVSTKSKSVRTTAWKDTTICHGSGAKEQQHTHTHTHTHTPYMHTYVHTNLPTYVPTYLQTDIHYIHAYVFMHTSMENHHVYPRLWTSESVNHNFKHWNICYYSDLYFVCPV